MEKITYETVKPFLTPRNRASHKGDFGHVLVVGGDVGFSGAVRLAAEAALRVGAGLVSVATHAQHADVLNTHRPEIMSHPVETPAALWPLLEKATVVVLGPGLGRSEWSHQLWETTISVQKPLVLDADGLNYLAEFPRSCAHWILTPHPGEAGRLLKKTAEVVQQTRIASAIELQKKFDGVAVLKGAGTLIASDHTLAICEAGNPGMASGGMGDVLSGVIGGLLAQQFSLDIAAKCGVLLHALAADCASEQYGERGLLASDLFFYLRAAVNPSIFRLPNNEKVK